MSFVLLRRASRHRWQRPDRGALRNLNWQWKCVRIALARFRGALVLVPTEDHPVTDTRKNNRGASGLQLLP